MTALLFNRLLSRTPLLSVTARSRSYTMSSSIAALVADARKALPAPSKDTAAVDAWVDRMTAGEDQDLQVRRISLATRINVSSA